MRYLKKLVNRIFRAGFNRAVIRRSSEEQGGLRRALRLMFRRPKLLWILVVAGLIAAVFEGGTMGILGLAVSVLVGEDSISTQKIGGILGQQLDLLIEGRSRGGIFLFLVGIAVIAQILRSSLIYVSQVCQIYLATAVSRDIQATVTAQIMSISYGQVSEYPPGTLASLIDQSQRFSDLVDLVSNTSRAIFMLIVYGTVMLFISPVMAFSSLIIVALLWVTLTATVKKIKQLSKRASRAKIFLWRWTIEYLNAPRLLRVFNSTEAARDLINDARDKELIPERNSTVIDAAIKPAIEIFTIFGAGVFLIFGYMLAGEGAAAAIPGLFIFVLVFYRLKPQLQIFADLRAKLARIFPRLELIEEFLQQTNAAVIHADGCSFNGFENHLEFRDICFRYSGSNKDALSQISFSVERGQTVALVGASGAGKSTIADLLLGLYQPTDGSIIVDGRRLDQLNLREWRDHIGVVDQDVFLLNASVKDNISFAREDTTHEVIEAAARAAHAHEFIEMLRDGYNTVIGERGYKLSGGQQQRLALARALIRNPDILVLDEATSALDTVSEKLIQLALEEMHHDRTIIVIAHRLSTIADADKIVVLDDGHIVEQGTREELLNKAGRFSKFWDLQAPNA